jgi:hypothetical protein
MAEGRRSYQLSEVFNEATIPVLTFVPPHEFSDLVGSLKTEGKHITLSGASGSGKTTVAHKALERAGIGNDRFHWVSGRDYVSATSLVEFLSREFDCDQNEKEINEYLRISGIFVIDDFHHLPEMIRKDIGLKLKRWNEIGIRVFVIGIAGSNKVLLDLDSELGIRNDPYEMKSQDETFINNVVDFGEHALNIKFSDTTRRNFVKASLGVPSAIQLICRVACGRVQIYETCESERIIDVDMAQIKDAVLKSYKAKFQNKLIGLAKGKQQARSVHNTYFEIIRQICMMELSEIPIAELHARVVKPSVEPDERNRKNTSFNNCLKNLEDVINQRGLSDAIYYDERGSVISIEDPSFRLYLTLVDLNEIERSVRVRKSRFPWDVAVSFAGEIRPLVERLRDILNSKGYTVFYDFDEQHKLWGENLRRKLSDVYAHEAQYMVVFLSKDYPEKDWTTFELEIGREARAKRTQTYLLPIVVDDVHVEGLSKNVGYVDLRSISIDQAAEILVRKIEDPDIVAN